MKKMLLTAGPALFLALAPFSAQSVEIVDPLSDPSSPPANAPNDCANGTSCDTPDYPIDDDGAADQSRLPLKDYEDPAYDTRVDPADGQPATPKE